MSFYPFILRKISVLTELILGHLCYSLTDVPPQPNSPPNNSRIPLVRTSSELAIHCDISHPFIQLYISSFNTTEVTFNNSIYNSTRQIQNQSLSPQSQSFSRSYGSNLPTSLIYIILLTRGYSPWRPDAVISTDNDTYNKSYSSRILYSTPEISFNSISFTKFKTLSRTESIPSFSTC